jgi:hypothetical protein
MALLKIPAIVVMSNCVQMCPYLIHSSWTLHR